MIEFKITGGTVLVDEDDVERIAPIRWCVGGPGYAMSPRGGLYMHRLIAGAARGQSVDHVDMNKLNNTKSNLRLATKAQNAYNVGTRSDNKSGYKGVSFDSSRGLWFAQIKFGPHQKKLGRFKTKDAAARVYDAWAREAHGEFARLNLPDD